MEDYDVYGCRPVERVLSGNLHPSPRTEISPIKLREEDHDLDHIAMLKQRIEAASQDRAKNGPGINKKHLFDLANKGGIQRHKSEPRRATNSSLSRRSRHSSNRPQQQQRRNQNLRNLVLENDEGLFRRFEARDIVPREGAAGIVRQNSLGERQARYPVPPPEPPVPVRRHHSLQHVFKNGQIRHEPQRSRRQSAAQDEPLGRRESRSREPPAFSMDPNLHGIQRQSSLTSRPLMKWNPLREEPLLSGPVGIQRTNSEPVHRRSALSSLGAAKSGVALNGGTKGGQGMSRISSNSGQNHPKPMRHNGRALQLNPRLQGKFPPESKRDDLPYPETRRRLILHLYQRLVQFYPPDIISASGLSKKVFEIKCEDDLSPVWASFYKAVEESGIYAIDIETRMGTCPKLPEILLLGDHRGTVLIVHLSCFMTIKNDGRPLNWIVGLPTPLRQLINNPRFIKLGSGLVGDLKDTSVNIGQVLELQRLWINFSRSTMCQWYVPHYTKKGLKYPPYVIYNRYYGTVFPTKEVVHKLQEQFDIFSEYPTLQGTDHVPEFRLASNIFNWTCPKLSDYQLTYLRNDAVSSFIVPILTALYRVAWGWEPITGPDMTEAEILGKVVQRGMVDMPSLFWVDHSSPVQMMPPPRALSPCGEEVEKIMAEPDQPRSHKPAAIVNVADFPLETEVVNNCRKSMSEDSASELFKKVMSEIGASVKEEQEQPRHKNEYVIKREPSWKRARKLFSLTGAPTLRNTGSETAVWKPTATTPGSDGWGSAALSGEKCTNEFQICIDENANNATAVSFSSSLLDATKSSIASTSFEFPAEGGENCQSRSCACAVQLPANVSGLCEMSTGGESSVEKNADADSSLPTDLIQDLDQLMTSSSDLFCKGRKSPCKSPRFKGS